jgi:hypothetical protein
MTPSSAAPLTCEDVWEREVLYCADDGFPLEGAAVGELLRGLQARLVAIYQDEVAARDELCAILA